MTTRNGMEKSMTRTTTLRWVPVTERLPPADREVAVIKKASEKWFVGYQYRQQFYDLNGHVARDPTHWAEVTLPEEGK